MVFIDTLLPQVQSPKRFKECSFFSLSPSSSFDGSKCLNLTAVVENTLLSIQRDGRRGRATIPTVEEVVVFDFIQEGR